MRRRRSAQSASELAIFGAILMFVIGLVLRTGLSSSQSLNEQLKAMRIALLESYKTGQKVYTAGQYAAGARNTASILVVEDRLSVDAQDKFQTRDRAPFISSASGTFSQNLFLPLDWGENYSLPVEDVIINGQRFPFTLAAFTQFDLTTLPACSSLSQPHHPCWSDQTGARLYQRVGNYPAADPPWQQNCPECFDLNFDGIPDVPVALRAPCGNTGTSDPNACFSWQWQEIDGDSLQAGMQADVDADGKEETVYATGKRSFTLPNGSTVEHVATVNVLDSQDGDVDTTIGDHENKPKPGLQNDVEMFSFTKSGTLYRIEEGKLFNTQTGQYVRETNEQDHVDIIQRVFRISNVTDRFCIEVSHNNWVPQKWLGADSKPTQWAIDNGVAGLRNPVEVCNNCFAKVNNQETCMDTVAKVIFIRSRIQDLRGRRWITRYEDLK